MCHKSTDNISSELVISFKRFAIVAAFSIALAYIEAAVVVYLRAIFFPDGFIFPLTQFGAGAQWSRLLVVETGREAATVVIISCAVWLLAPKTRQRLAWFLIVFAVWDIFYYVWLKVLIGWPQSFSDWDILFLIPIVWASPVWMPLLISLTMLVFAFVLLGEDKRFTFTATAFDITAFFIAAFAIIVCFCQAGRYIKSPDYRSHFNLPLFLFGYALAVVVFIKCTELLDSGKAKPNN